MPRSSRLADGDPGGAAAQPDPWAVGGNLYVGKTGTGTLTAEAGGVVSSSHGYLGYSGNSSSGEVTVTGSGSQWNGSGVIVVGHYGTGMLNVESSGVVSPMPWVTSDVIPVQQARRRSPAPILSGITQTN